MATAETSLQDFHFSKDELAILSRSLKDDKFKALFSEYVRDVNDSDNRKQYEDDVKKLEKERGVDAVFVHPIPGFALSVGRQGNEDLCCFVNICSSDEVQKPTFVRVCSDGKRGQNWSLPHVLPKPRRELASEKDVGEARVSQGEGHAESGVSRQGLVHDVVFHPDALRLAARSPIMKQTLIKSAMDSLSQNFGLKVGNPHEMKKEYIGVPLQSVIKRVFDKKLFERTESTCFKQLDERTSKLVKNSVGLGLIKNSNTKNDNENINVKCKEVNEHLVPVYKIKHVSKMDLQDYSVTLIPQCSKPWRPQALEVEIELPGVCRASQVDANVCHQSILLLTESTPKYKLDLPLPYPVNEDTSAAKFDVSTQKLTLTLAVLPSDKKTHLSMDDHSPSSDSGIECDPDCRNSHDGDNSSEASVSSQEEMAQKESNEVGDDEDCVFESDPPPQEKHLVPSYTLHQDMASLMVSLHCGNILSRSIKTDQCRDNMASIEFSSMGGGQTLLQYKLIIETPDQLTSGALSCKVEETRLVLTLWKAVPAPWTTCQLGQEGCMETVNLDPLPLSPTQEHKISKTTVTLSENVEEGKRKEESRTVVCITRPIRMSRTVSMCETGMAPPLAGFRLLGPTCSWPRGILKSRTRSLSESHVGADLPAILVGSVGSSVDLENKMGGGEETGEESTEEAMISSSLGEKKSVRFNEVVSRQLFRSNSSILGQRAKNQKKAQKKRKGQEKRSSDSEQKESGGDTTTDGLTTSTDDDTATDATEDLDDINLAQEDVENNNLNSPMSIINQNYQESIRSNRNEDDNAIKKNDEDSDSGFILKTNKKKKKRNKKNKAKFEPSNSLIFQLDIDK